MKIVPQDVITSTVAHMEQGTTDLAASVVEVPATHFTSLERSNAEIGVFRRMPLIVAHASELPEAGDFVTRDVLGTPILLLRQADGGVAAFLNMCRHRGGKVEQAANGNKRAFVCAYHGWSYGRDGGLRAIPFQESYGMDVGSRNLDLNGVSCEERHGLVWLDLSNDEARNVADHLGEADARLASYDFAKAINYMTQKVEVACNWKLVMDGVIDILHPPFLHPGGVGDIFPANVSVWRQYGRHGSNFVARARLAEKIKAGAPIEAFLHYFSANLVIFPNSMFVSAPDHIEYWSVWPRAGNPSKTDVEIRFLIDKTKINNEMEERLQRSWEILRNAAVNEDFPMEEWIQQNALANPDKSFLYGRNEISSQNLHRQMARELSESLVEKQE